MRRLAILLLLLLTLGWVQPPEMPWVVPLWELIDQQQPVNPAFAPHVGLRYWWTTLPWLYGGAQWWDLIASKAATLTNMTSGFGWASDTQGWTAGQLVFDGTNDYIVATGLLGSPASITISVVASTTSAASGTNNQLFSIGDYAGIQIDSTDHIEVSIYQGGSWYTQNAVAWGKNGTGWHHIVYTQTTGSPGTETVYVDGVQQHTLTQAYAPIGYTGQGTDTYFGRHGNGSSRFLHGSLADVRVWDRAITASEVWLVYSDILDRCRMALQRRAARLLGAPATGNFLPMFQ